jgi:2,3-bisphosphoglycerate-independent phosphoglycerate mutase
MEHLFKLTDISKIYGVDKTFVHCFTDGRDSDPKSGAGFIRDLEEHLKQSTGQIASVIG